MMTDSSLPLELSSVAIAVGGHDDDEDIETGGNDDDDVNAKNENENENKRMVDFSVGGMTCSMCSSSVLKLLTEMPGITYVTVTLATNLAHVEYIESEELTAEIIADEIECIGYDINDIMKIETVNIKPQQSEPVKRILKTVELAVGGMTCSMCSSAVHKALSEMPGVESVDVSLSTNIARIHYYDYNDYQNQEDVDADVKPYNYPHDLSELVEDIGYDVNDVIIVPSTSSQQQQQQQDSRDTFDDENNTEEVPEDRLERILRQQDSQLKKQKNAFLWSAAGTLPILTITMIIPHILNETNIVRQFLEQTIQIFGCTLLMQAIIVWLLTTPVQFWCGYSFYKTSYHGIRRGVLGMDVLVVIGTTSSYIYAFMAMWSNDPGYRFFETSAVLITFVLLGKWMNAMAVRQTSKALTQLMKLQAKTAIKITPSSTSQISQSSQSSWDPLINSYSEKVVPIQNVYPGDIVKILRGSNIPADGIVLHGELTVDQSMITGESIPVLKSPGDDVLGGTICSETGTTMSTTKGDNNHALTAAAFVRVTGVGADSALSQIVQMVQEAQSRQVPIQNYADGIASIFVPVVVIFSTVTFIAWYACCILGIVPSGWYGEENPVAFSLLFGIASLVISCPCALGLATPTAVMVGTGVGASHGILMKGGETLEVASKANVVVFDKTGTLTRGKPAVTDFTRLASDEFLLGLMNSSNDNDKNSLDSSQHVDDYLVWLLGSLERNSEHILASAIVNFAEKKIDTLLQTKPFAQPSEFVAITGRGASGIINGDTSVAIGNRSFAERENMKISPEVEACMQKMELDGKTAIIAGINGTACAVLGIADEIKEEAPDTIQYLKKLGIEVWMVTGDSNRTAYAIARQLDLPAEYVIAEALPNSKVEQVKKLQQQGKIVCMVGDGVNDSPALAEADVGISMGTGSDIAAEASDMVIVGGNIASTCTALHLSRAIFRRIQLNFVFSMVYNIIGIPLAAGVLFPIFHTRLPPTLAAVAMALSSVSVVFSSLALKLYKPPDILATKSSSFRRLGPPNILRLGQKRKPKQEYEMVVQDSDNDIDSFRDELV
ncbi:MAG: Cu+-exporting ATPase [Bacillariaceae sp.]|jgi:Cu+-exporting ATPase